MAVSDKELAELVKLKPTQTLEPFKGVKKLPLEEFFTSGHRTCQGCESSLVMKMMVKAAGPRTIVLGSTGCMYVANTTYYSTSWVVPWMHTQLGSSGSAGLGTAAGLKALMRKGKIKDEPINVIAFCGDGGGADMGLSAISATLTHPDYNVLILMYDNESYANTDIQLSGSTPYGAHTTFSPPGKLKRIMHHRWKKNMAGMMAAGHPDVPLRGDGRHVLPRLFDERRAQGALHRRSHLHPFARPLPEGLGLRPHAVARAGRAGGRRPASGRSTRWRTGVFHLVGKTRDIADGRLKRLPVRDYLLKQGRFAHFTEDDIAYFQSKVDETWERWLIPGVIPFRKQIEEDRPPA